MIERFSDPAFVEVEQLIEFRVEPDVESGPPRTSRRAIAFFMAGDRLEITGTK